jgi:hypothetical protein
LGPAIGFGLPLKKYLHVPTFLVANVIVDVEPLLVLVLGLHYPLHGYLHTFIFASFTGLALGYVMFSIDRLLYPIYRTIRLIANNNRSMRARGQVGAAQRILHNGDIVSWVYSSG